MLRAIPGAKVAPPNCLPPEAGSIPRNVQPVAMIPLAQATLQMPEVQEIKRRIQETGQDIPCGGCGGCAWCMEVAAMVKFSFHFPLMSFHFLSFSSHFLSFPFIFLSFPSIFLSFPFISFHFPFISFHFPLHFPQKMKRNERKMKGNERSMKGT